MNWHAPIDLHVRQSKSLFKVGDLGQGLGNVVKFYYES